ncbi:MAG TPA: ABC transporter ATP-binding protein [Ktedonobacteraceae bacterium]|jgi:ABC-2 type transport system ATP-binding protein|nr:ABC transporter ATP-binding protein [Ktedonobacteraceae bacterium]
MATQSEQEVTIEVQHLVKRYPRAAVNAVDDISFSVKRGEIFGLLGPNGAGKTTTIGVLTTNILPTSGQAFLTGINVVEHPMKVKERIAVVPQQSNLDRSLRAREILTFHANYHGVSRAERNARADALLQELGLGNRGKDRVLRYSGGMAQRLMLARALMHSPDVLFLDEPTNNLDPQSRLFLWDRIRALHEHGVTILLTTHDMHEADQLCDRIAIMDHGKILVLDTAEELKKLIPGGIFLELRISVSDFVPAGQNGSSTKDKLLEALRGISETAKVEEVQDGEQENTITLVRLYDQNAGSLTVDATQVVARSGAEIRDMHLARPSLEDVFIYLTGRNLR